MSVSIHPLTEADLEAAAVILSSAFQRPGNWLNDLRFYRRLQPDGYFGAYQDGMLVGIVGAIIYAAFAYVARDNVYNFQRLVVQPTGQHPHEAKSLSLQTNPYV